MADAPLPIPRLGLTRAVSTAAPAGACPIGRGVRGCRAGRGMSTAPGAHHDSRGSAGGVRLSRASPRRRACCPLRQPSSADSRPTQPVSSSASRARASSASSSMGRINQRHIASSQCTATNAGTSESGQKRRARAGTGGVGATIEVMGDVMRTIRQHGRPPPRRYTLRGFCPDRGVSSPGWSRCPRSPG